LNNQLNMKEIIEENNIFFIDDIEIDISNIKIEQLLIKNKSFDFLNNDEEDIYSDKDLKIKY